MTYREAALRWAISQIGITEVGYNNRGPEVDAYQRCGAEYVGYVGFPWCAAFVMCGLRKAGYQVEEIPNRAGVGFVETYAREKGYLVDRPLRGDVFAMRIDADDWPDHMGFVERVLSLGPLGWIIRTVEGNTSPDEGGSQDDGGGVYRRIRHFSRGRVKFIRFPGEQPVLPVVIAPANRSLPENGPYKDEEAERTAFFVWRRNGGFVFQRPIGLRTQIPADWWKAYPAWLAKYPWPKPLPDWYWAWQKWYDDGRVTKRPASAPLLIPMWAWKRYAVHIGGTS